ncbi:L,D-transpeptidase family protein [Roseospirillum parvum]|uniref:L,D-transpeptidase catalytic domain n=1 Tax=Roseospirillum parvum TaxID=83401 RepID=A0A1G8DU97_9PROT|nr:L,D-transpeptidase family protein [Roseospirillum parvum]SDH61185.1 L,D-transpeptidase catalytic domain [Roseospirillum parvum]
MEIQVSASGRLTIGPHRWPCALGRGGVRTDKREGDGATPTGRYPLRHLLYRPDRWPTPPATTLPTQAIRPNDGWCDDPTHQDYNRPVTLPHPASAENLWRQDHLYDLVIVLGHNDDPPQPGLGSAIFLHLAGVNYPPTEGCIALAPPHMTLLLKLIPPTTNLTITP